jgi:hypothetical protein
MITIAFYNADGMLIGRLAVRDRQEEAERGPAMFRQMEAQIGWDSTKPGHNFHTQPMIGPGHKRRVIYYADGKMVGWYVYHNDRADEPSL